MKFSYTPQGVCSRLIEVDVADGIVNSITVCGGCHGNLQGLTALAAGRPAAEVAAALRGIRCGHKATSCPDQIAAALDACAGCSGN